jgi:Carbohydrate binding domain
VTLAETALVPNGGFEQGGPTLAPWIWRNDIDAALTQDTSVKFSGAASAKITVPTIGSTNWQVQLRTLLAALVPHRAYQVSFEIIASRSRAANVRVQSGAAPYRTAVESTFNVGTTWTHVSFVWTPAFDITDPFVGFNLSQDVGTVWIDNVALTDLTI